MPHVKITIARLSLVPMMFACATTYAADSGILIELTNIRNPNGVVSCYLFNAEDGYPEVHSKAFANVRTNISGGRAYCDFINIPAGRYAAIVVHDENLNGKMDKNIVGVPIEGYAASNNVRSTFSAPKFDDAAFVIKGGNKVMLRLKMGY